jgi:uncharacterized membrane protein
MLFDPLILETSNTATFAFTLWAERFLQEFASLLKIILEFIAILIVAIALIKTLQNIIRTRRQHLNIFRASTIRLDLGLSLALSLEFLLAADIVGTAVSPGWEEIAQLAAITGIRTFLNFFLQREVRELEAMPESIAEMKKFGE